MTMTDIIDDAMDVVRCAIRECTNVSRDPRWPLDRRAQPIEIYLADDCIIVDTRSVKSLNYYGGFEYVDSDYRAQLGDYTFFSTEDSRVNQVFEAYQETDNVTNPE